MNDVLFFDNSMPHIGLKARKPKAGPELQLVKDFLDFELNKFLSVKRTYDLAVFLEPQLETGYPDIVFVQYNSKSFETWSDSRKSLQVSDLKVLQHIVATKGRDSESLEKELGLDSKSLLRSLERLLDSRLIKRTAKKWKVMDFNKNFGVKRVIAVEAKLNNWTVVFEQACLNKWFSSESYILSPVKRPTERILKRFDQFGIGLFLSNEDGITKVKEAVEGDFPSCYSSLLFNEWIGRHLITKK